MIPTEASDTKKFAHEPPHFCCGNGQIMKNNPYTKFFRSLRELDIGEETMIILNCDSVPDQGLYNAPTTDEVAATWLDTSTTLDTNSPHIVVHGKSKRSHRIMHYYGCYDPNAISTSISTWRLWLAYRAKEKLLT